MADTARKVGARIKELRLERQATDPRWTQDYLARQVEEHMSGTQMSRYERGENMPGEKRLERIAAILETDVADLYAGPLGERGPRSSDLMDSLTDAEETPSLKRVEDRLAALETNLLGRLAEVQSDLEAALSSQARPKRSRGGTGS